MLNRCFFSVESFSIFIIVSIFNQFVIIFNWPHFCFGFRLPLIPSVFELEFYQIDPDNYCWSNRIYKHCLNDDISSNQIPVCIEIWILTIYKWNSLRCKISIWNQNENTCVHKLAEEDVSGGFRSQISLCLSSNETHDPYDKESD